MTDALTCGDADRRALPARYVAGTLDSVSRASFEAHFLTCARCQDEIALAAGVRRAARSPASVQGVQHVHSPRRIAAYLLAAAGVAFAAFVVPITADRVRDRHNIEALGVLQAPPAYGGVPVRGDVSASDSLFGIGMAAYGARDYRASAADLRKALVAGAAVPPTSFFLGASLLMVHEPRAAADEFARVIAAGESSYRNEAHYYRGLALLQMDRADDAAGELKMVHGGSVGGAAVALLARLAQSAR